MHVSLHGPRSNRWAFTERGAASVEREATWLRIGPSSLTWQGDALQFDLEEYTAWNPARIRGTVTVHPEALTGKSYLLDAAGRHRWSPLAPRSRVEVALREPGVSWSGNGYFDTNAGSAPLEQDFTTWHWSCSRLKQGATILYDVNRMDDTSHCLSLHVERSGRVNETPPPPLKTLPRTRWGIGRATRSHGEATVAKTLLDSPFYSRSVLATEMMGEPTTAMHESLSMYRFGKPWVQAMLPFRIPRRG